MEINKKYWMDDGDQFPFPIEVTVIEINDKIRVIDKDGDEWLVDKKNLHDSL